jgi:hypothetical protein
MLPSLTTTEGPSGATDLPRHALSGAWDAYWVAASVVIRERNGQQEADEREG